MDAKCSETTLVALLISSQSGKIAKLPLHVRPHRVTAEFTHSGVGLRVASIYGISRCQFRPNMLESKPTPSADAGIFLALKAFLYFFLIILRRFKTRTNVFPREKEYVMSKYA